MNLSPGYCVLVTGLLALAASTSQAADEFDSAPISYRDSTPDNRVSRLQQKLDAGTQMLTWDADLGYLKTLLDALDVPTESQMLVFSKTSLQVRRIKPRTPRAIYFSDDVYVGFCQSGEVLEISAVDPKLGTVFYSLDQEETDQPAFKRHVDNCLICHSSSRTKGVPGHLVRSLFVDAGGQPIFSAGSRVVDHTTPIKDRWGGWYVTGKHGAQSHLGNLVIQSRRVPDDVDNAQGQNVTDLADRLNVDRYLTPHSDIVALMVLEHQAMVHNHLTKAGFSARQAMHHQATMNRVLGYPADNRLDSTASRIQNAGDDLVEVLLLVDEAALTEEISGTSGYAKQFAAMGVRDNKGRSLRDLDLTQRLFRYPCSYLIYSEAFDALPAELREYVWRRLWDVLSGSDKSEQFAHLSDTDRTAIVEILRDTKPELPRYWFSRTVAESDRAVKQ